MYVYLYLRKKKKKDGGEFYIGDYNIIAIVWREKAVEF